MDERILCDIFLDRFRPQRTFQVDIHAFDRMREYDSRNNLKWLTESIYRLLYRERMLHARGLQTKTIQSGASLATATSATVVAREQDKNKGKGKGKVKRQVRVRSTGQSR